GGVIVHTLVSDIQTVNPTLPTDKYSNWITSKIFDGLIGTSRVDGQPRPLGLADGWEIAEDGVTYTIKLHEGVRWHDGEAFTADDVIFTYDMALSEDSLTSKKSIIEENLASY